MSDIAILSWLNENGLSPYPLCKSFGYDNLIVDANFLQFDSFVPTLQTLSVNSDYLYLKILFDYGIKLVEIPRNTFPTPFKIYDNTRYLGTLVFSSDIQEQLNSILDQTLVLNIKFLPHLVKGIPSKAGVYSIDHLFGEVHFKHDVNIWYDIAGQDVTFNAVALKTVSDELFLRTLNSVEPLANSVFLQETELVKISAEGLNTVQFSLVGTGVNNLISSANNTIPTNIDP